MQEEVLVPVGIEMGDKSMYYQHHAAIAVHAVYGRKDGRFRFAETAILLDGESLDDRPKPAQL